MKAARAPSCRVMITLGNDIREEFVEKAAFTIGRGRDADIQINSPNISRVHLSVEIREAAIWVADFGSSNGSFINTKEIARHQAVQYKPGDKIKLGEAKEVLTLEMRAPLLVVDPVGEINLDDTQPEAEIAAAVAKATPPPIIATIDHAAAERILNQARAIAGQLKEAAEIDAKKIVADAGIEAQQKIQDATDEGRRILGNAHLERQKVEIEASTQATQILKDAEDATKPRVEEIYRNANLAGEQILSEYKPKADKMIVDARLTATTIKTSAQEEADKLLKETYQKCTSVQITSEESALKNEKEAKAKADAILKEAQDEVDKILREAQDLTRKMRQTNEQDLNEIKAQSEKKAQQRLDQAKLEADKIILHANESAEAQKQSILAKANDEAKETINDATRKASSAAREVSRSFQDEHLRLSQTLETLGRDISRINLQKAEAETRYNLSNDDLSLAKSKLADVQKQLSEAEISANQKVAELQSRVTALDESIAAKTKLAQDLDVHAQEALNKRHQEEEATLQFRNESSSLQKKISDDQALEAQLVARVASLDKHIEQERTRMKETLDGEMNVLRKEISADIKKMRDQANVDHAKARASQDTELTNIRNKELDLIKSLRAEADAKAKLARRHQAIEMARALEVYLTPKLQDALKTQDLPAEHFQNFFKDITNVVTNLLVDDSPSGVDAGQIMNPKASIADFANTKQRKKIFMQAAGATVVLLGVLFYFQDKYGDHRTASELFAEELREKEAKKPKFVPTITNDYKSSYTDNVIFTDSYAQFKADSQKQSKWIKDLNKFFINDLNLSENSVVKFIPLEAELISQLEDKRKIIHFETQNDDIKGMRDLEQNSVEKITEILGGEENYKAFRDFEKNYFQQNRMPASAK